MNWFNGTARLLAVAYVLWSATFIPYSLVRLADDTAQAAQAVCTYRRSASSMTADDWLACLGAMQHRFTVAYPDWWRDGGYLLWLIPPLLATVVFSIVLAAARFVWRGYVRPLKLQ
jgi:hypothetical protein